MARKEKIYLVSACLVGVRCRYNGGAKTSRAVLNFLKGKRFVPVCLETLAGLPIPRPPATFIGGTGKDVLRGKASILDDSDNDVTEKIIRGAQETLRIAKLVR